MTVTVKTVKSPNLMRYDRIARQRVRKAVAAGGQMVRTTAVKSINQQSGGGKRYIKYNPNRTHLASAPNTPPNTDTGYLVNNIFLTFTADKLSAMVTSRAKYSAALEFGARSINLEPRPFMVPALEENRNKIQDLFKKALRGMQPRRRSR